MSATANALAEYRALAGIKKAQAYPVEEKKFSLRRTGKAVWSWVSDPFFQELETALRSPDLSELGRIYEKWGR